MLLCILLDLFLNTFYYGLKFIRIHVLSASSKKFFQFPNKQEFNFNVFYFFYTVFGFTYQFLHVFSGIIYWFCIFSQN